MPDCIRFEELIGAAVDGELSESDRDALNAHLAQCEACRSYYEALLAVSRTMGEDVSAPPPELTERIMAAVRAETPAKRPKVVPFSRRLRPVALAAAAALVIWAGVRLGAPQKTAATTTSSAREEAKSAALDRGPALRAAGAPQEAVPEAAAEDEPAESVFDAASANAPMFAAMAAPAAEELILTGEEDLAALEGRTELTFIDASACRDYEGLLRLREALPDCQILWTVTVGEQEIRSLDESVTLSDARGLREALRYLPGLRTVDLRACHLTPEEKTALAETYPDITFVWE